MLLALNLVDCFNILAIVVSVLILIRLLLLAGRLVRAAEKIAEKNP